MNDNTVTPLLYVHNMFTKNIAIEKHTIHSVNDSNPWVCFRHCAKDCDCVTFQVTERMCELLDTDQHGAAGDLVNRAGTLIFSMQQSVPKVSTHASMAMSHVNVDVLISFVLPRGNGRKKNSLLEVPLSMCQPKPYDFSDLIIMLV